MFIPLACSVFGLGIKALSSVVRLNPAYAAINQEIVMECLDHTDQTIRTKVCMFFGF